MMGLHLAISAATNFLCSTGWLGSLVAYHDGAQRFLPLDEVWIFQRRRGQAFGGRIIRAKQIMHGKTSPIHHKGLGVFAGLPSPFQATRYHSLVIERATIPDCLEITAWTEAAEGGIDEIMGVRHKELLVEGVQFHPESILTEHGHDLLNNFLSAY